jgi:hypothetical protein
MHDAKICRGKEHKIFSSLKRCDDSVSSAFKLCHMVPQILVINLAQINVNGGGILCTALKEKKQTKGNKVV